MVNGLTVADHNYVANRLRTGVESDRNECQAALVSVRVAALARHRAELVIENPDGTSIRSCSQNDPRHCQLERREILQYDRPGNRNFNLISLRQSLVGMKEDPTTRKIYCRAGPRLGYAARPNQLPPKVQRKGVARLLPSLRNGVSRWEAGLRRV